MTQHNGSQSTQMNINSLVEVAQNAQNGRIRSGALGLLWEIVEDTVMVNTVGKS